VSAASPSSRRADVLVIGLGAAGALAAHVLTQAGLVVTAVEAGGWAPTRDGWWERSRPTVRRAGGARATPDRSGTAMANAVGGSKHLSANQSYRLPVPGDWPMSDVELAPYHERVERLHAVLPTPPAAWTDLMADAARGLGWSTLRAPVATAGPIGRRLLEPALTSNRLTVATHAIAVEVTVDGEGQVDGARVWQHGHERRLTARHVVLAAHTYESVRLLALSRSPAHRGGLGNASGQLGRHFTTHSFLTAHGLFPGHDLRRETGLPGHAVAVPDFEGVRGSLLQASMRPSPSPEVTAALGGSARSVGSAWAQPGQPAQSAHRLDLDPSYQDALGHPVLRVTHDLSAADRRAAVDLQQRLQEWLRAGGAARILPSTVRPQPISTHAYGGACMGEDPRTSVVDSFGGVHDSPGLTVLGACTFPSPGGRGPTQTIEALAWRAAEHLARRLR
jgi:gluconate 2-dehydrogenase alpha chain